MSHSPTALRLSMVSPLRDLVNHWASRLKETPLLLGWIITGLLISLLTGGWVGLGLGLINLSLVGLYAALIRWMTPHPAHPEPVRRPRLELALALGLLGLFIVIQLLDFDVWIIQPFYGWVKILMKNVYLGVHGPAAIPDWALQDVFMAVSSTIKQLLPTLLLLWLLGIFHRRMGLFRPHWALSAALVGITTLLGFVTGYIQRAPVGQVLGLYLIGIFVNALPEELFFRGFLLPRLEKVLANPLNALVISALLFNAIHIPIDLSSGVSPLAALLDVFSMSYPSGLIWGYLYLRTRSIVPGMLWHAANGNLGFIMMSL